MKLDFYIRCMGCNATRKLLSDANGGKIKAGTPCPLCEDGYHFAGISSGQAERLKEQRDRMREFCSVVLPESPIGSEPWDREAGEMFVELNRKDREKYRELLDKASSYCPPFVQDEIRELLKKSN